MITYTSKRWTLINTKTGNARKSFDTRDAARTNKRTTERIYDNDTGMFVR
jgi:hypothetical protein